ncbi:dipeptidase [Alicyclobacillus macrosporangiidus]|uniref:Acetylornithine deacetylase/Succinyl-diaminopimelate desuccinylase n=1 Tax=Alicyclobacillus macrosporangiidus TaxID=392015 RepID=A0A1I7HXZ4_9BACL|nr:dipeptidase [Alicyclobacillus macrosporangiidus]SFU65501.1 Acetylornithine deacetylase/Succinyl-diaminopimelate desuccinylase [Alicyclobacillus macrosporangiidus]
MSEAWRSYLETHRDRFLNEFLELLRIPSVSTEPSLAGEVRRAAEWTADRLRQAGIENVQVMDTQCHPVVYGDWLHAGADKPTLLFYGHFDVQPADPLELWTSPPFDPRVEDGCIFARGASDMKGSLLLPAIACEALLKTEGKLPVNVKFLYEGEEEIGSPSLTRFIQENRDRLACDMVVCADGGVGSEDDPVVNVGRRGLTALEVTVRSANTDLHSGGAGGMVHNALHALVQILASMRDEEGRILVEGFYDDVRPLTEEERAEIAKAPFDADAYKAAIGIKDFFGEPEYTPQERNVARPTLEVNGLWGGYQGAGTKTVIPCEAHAKITCRLVPDQDPERVAKCVIDHIHKVAPRQVEVSIETFPGDADPYLLPADHPGLQALEKAVAAVSKKWPARVRGGGTVPITGMMKRLLGVDTITLGASGGMERAHAPNEFVRIRNFERIQYAYCMLLQELGAR